MNVCRAAGENESVEVTDFFGEVRRGKAQRDFNGVRPGLSGSRQIFFIGSALALKFFFSSAIRDSDARFRAGFAGHGQAIVSFASMPSNWRKFRVRSGDLVRPSRQAPIPNGSFSDASRREGRRRDK